MADLQEIVDSLELLAPESGLRNVRILLRSGRMPSAFSTNSKKLAEAIVAQDNKDDVMGVYVQLQEIDPSIITNVPKGKGVKREHIRRFLWFCVDVDTERPNKSESSATEEEKSKSWKVAMAIYRYLRSQGWPEGVIADSGNGWHLLWRVDMPYTPELRLNDPNYQILQDCLNALAARFNNADANVDTSLAEPEQLIKVWGTAVRKSPESTEERPWRQSFIHKVPGSIEVVPRPLLLKLMYEAPRKPDTKKSPRKERGYNGLHPDFSIHKFVEFWNEKLEAADYGWSFNGHTKQEEGTTYFGMDWCPTACTSHKGDPLKSSLVLSDDGLGWECFSDDCTGKHIGDLLRSLREHSGYKGRGFPIWEGDDEWEEDDDELLDGVEMVGIDDMELDDDDVVNSPNLSPAAAEDPAEPEGETTTEEPAEEPNTPKAKFGDGTPEQLGEALLQMMLREPERNFTNYALYKARFKGRFREIEGDDLRRSLYYVWHFEKEFHKLPSKADLLDFIINHKLNAEDKNRDETVSYLGALDDGDTTLTWDTTMQRFLHKTDVRAEAKAWKKGYAILKNDEDIQKARNLVRKQWSESLAIGGDHGMKPGAIQEPDHIENLRAEFQKDMDGVNDDRKFKTGFLSIDNSTLKLSLDAEHAMAIFGPSNNGKTSLALGMAYNFSRTGKNGIIFVGEHQALKIEKRLALMHSYQFREKFIIPGLHRWEGNNNVKPTHKDMENLQFVLEDLRSMKTLPGYIEVKNINSIGGDLESVVSYLEGTNKKYAWDYLLIDPLDSVVPTGSGKDGNEWQLGSQMVDRIFDLTRDFDGGKGIFGIVTAQIKSKEARDIERIQCDDEYAEDYERRQDIRAVLKQDKNIQFFTTLVQRFDIALGVALDKKGSSKGILVQGRAREGSDFDYLKFKLDEHSHYPFEYGYMPMQMDVNEVDID